MNIAERIKSHYESTGFEGDYMAALHESFGNDRHTIINRIKELIINDSDFASVYDKLEYEEVKKVATNIYNYIDENFETFVSRFRSYYVGYKSLDSVNFGEQEEQLTGLTNHRTGKNYGLRYIKQTFERAGYFVNNRNYAYMNLSSKGLHVWLNLAEIPESVYTI